MSEIDYDQERKLAEAHALKSEQVAKRFERQMPEARRNWNKMMEYTQKFSTHERERQSYLFDIMDYRLSGKYPEEIIVVGEDVSDEKPRTFADDWEVWIRNEYAEKASQCTSISEVGAMMLDDIEATLIRRVMATDVFVMGMRGGKTAIITGEMGSGKTDFALQELLLNLYKLPNVQIVTNICITDFNGLETPLNVEYASTIPQALRHIITHALRKFDFLDGAKDDRDLLKREAYLEKHPYVTYWFVDEAGISNTKHDAMSKAWKVMRNLTKISRKLKATKIAIYQFDEAPDDIVRVASHIYHKPGTDFIHMVKFKINNIMREITLSGVMGWKQRKEIGSPYIGFDTDDTAGMTIDDFDTQAFLDYINQIADGKPLGSRLQFERGLEFLDMLENKNVSFNNPDAPWYFLYRIRHFSIQEADYLERSAKVAATRTKKKELREEAKKVLVYSRWVYLCKMAKYSMPDRKIYPDLIKLKFKEMEEKYPKITAECMFPDKVLPGPVD